MNRKDIGTLYLVIPCYNEEEIIGTSIEQLQKKLEKLQSDSKVKANSKLLFVNDGSKDETFSILQKYASQDKKIAVINFSRNFGHQNAILSGMMFAEKYADMVITLDADLQQDINAIDQFIEKYMNGCEIVYGVRNDRKTDSFFKGATATFYYGLMHFLGCEVITNHADYRLMSKKALQALQGYQEVSLFLRGLIPTMGFQSDVVYFDVKKREAGTSKYTIKKMLKLAFDGITSFSVKPLHMITALGGIMCTFSLLMAIYIFADWLHGNTVPGYATTVMVPLIMEGVTLLSLGIIGEYIGKMYLETKQRPRYLIESIIWNSEDNNE